MSGEHVELADLAGMRLPVFHRKLAATCSDVADGRLACRADEPRPHPRIIEELAAAFGRAVAAEVLSQVFRRIEMAEGFGERALSDERQGCGVRGAGAADSQRCVHGA